MVLPILNASLPTSGRLSFGFQRETHVHNGIDIPAREGAAVYAVADGVVRFATRGWRQGFSGYGRVVVLAHPQLGVETLYAHLLEPIVTEGQQVVAGQQIALVGRTAYTKDDQLAELAPGAEHLHFEVLGGARYPVKNTVTRFDPVAWLMSAADSTEVVEERNRDAEIPFGSGGDTSAE